MGLLLSPQFDVPVVMPNVWDAEECGWCGSGEDLDKNTKSIEPRPQPAVPYGAAMAAVPLNRATVETHQIIDLRIHVTVVGREWEIAISPLSQPPTDDGAD